MNHLQPVTPVRAFLILSAEMSEETFDLLMTLTFDLESPKVNDQQPEIRTVFLTSKQTNIRPRCFQLPSNP